MMFAMSVFAWLTFAAGFVFCVAAVGSAVFIKSPRGLMIVIALFVVGMGVMVFGSFGAGKAMEWQYYERQVQQR